MRKTAKRRKCRRRPAATARARSADKRCQMMLTKRNVRNKRQAHNNCSCNTAEPRSHQNRTRDGEGQITFRDGEDGDVIWNNNLLNTLVLLMHRAAITVGRDGTLTKRLLLLLPSAEREYYCAERRRLPAILCCLSPTNEVIIYCVCKS